MIGVDEVLSSIQCNKKRFRLIICCETVAINKLRHFSFRKHHLEFICLFKNPFHSYIYITVGPLSLAVSCSSHMLMFLVFHSLLSRTFLNVSRNSRMQMNEYCTVCHLKFIFLFKPPFFPHRNKCIIFHNLNTILTTLFCVYYVGAFISKLFLAHVFPNDITSLLSFSFV